MVTFSENWPLGVIMAALVAFQLWMDRRTRRNLKELNRDPDPSGSWDQYGAINVKMHGTLGGYFLITVEAHPDLYDTAIDILGLTNCERVAFGEIADEKNRGYYKVDRATAASVREKCEDSMNMDGVADQARDLLHLDPVTRANGNYFSNPITTKKDE